ncbi:extracellular calcium-sensing receptor-like, partial [Pimephales promelas]
VSLRDFRMAQIMIFAIEEINRSENLLPNVSIGYRIYDTCGSRLSSMGANMALMNGEQFASGDRCNGLSPIHAIIGETESSNTVILSRTTGPFKIPVISPSASCECLSNRKDYPYFFRTIASDYHQSRALAFIIKYFGWSWVGAVNSDNDYGNYGMAIFLNTAEKEGICVEYSVKFQRTETEKLKNVVDTIQKGTAKVIVAFLTNFEMNNLLDYLIIQNITGLQVIGVEAWITADSMVTPNSFHVLGGSLGFAVKKNNIEGFADYISPSASCECLSNRKDYPYFFRTIASDYHQSRALAFLIKYFGWSWVGAVNSDNDYGNYGMAIFLNTAEKEGICVEYSVKFQRTETEKLKNVVDTIQKGTAKVIVAFLTNFEMNNLLDYLIIQNITGLQVIGVEAWITADSMVTPNSFHVLGGSLGFAVKKNNIEGFADYVIKSFWDTAFPCSQTKGNSSQYQLICNAYQDLLVLKSNNEDVSEQRYASNVYKSVYAVAHSLHNLLKCKEKEGCETDLKIQPQQVVKALKKVNFTMKMGDHVWFDSTGAVVAQYEVVNWQQDSNGSIKFKPVGYYDASLAPDQRFVLNTDNIIWAGGQLEKPRSVCSESCPPGTRKAAQKGRPVCCYDCIPCAEGEISNETDSNNCKQCQGEYWSNAQKNKCVLKAVEFLSFSEVMGIVLVFFSLFGVGLTVFMVILFYSKKDTPIVKANNSELSFLLLFSLILCFLCSLTFIGRPTEWSCMLRHTAFGITFVLCISCVLGKTIVVLMAFKATLPGSNVMKWFGPPQQRLSVLAFTLIQ